MSKLRAIRSLFLYNFLFYLMLWIYSDFEFDYFKILFILLFNFVDFIVILNLIILKFYLFFYLILWIL